MKPEGKKVEPGVLLRMVRNNFYINLGSAAL
jgi:hypothetical protein